MANAAEKVYDLIRDTVAEQGVELWDVRFLKEGASWYLRVFIDKPQGISIDDCTAVSRAIDPIIDAADPIDVSYFLEVCSPGINRELTRPQHFQKMIGKRIKVKLFGAIDGKKEFSGVLTDAGDTVTIENEGKIHTFALSAVSKACLCEPEEER